MRKIPILVLFCIVFLSGCVSNQDTQKTFFQNDVIKLEEYSVSAAEMYEGGITKLEFVVQSYADQDVRNVEVNFFDHKPFEILQLKCEDQESTDGKCFFDKIEFINSKRVSVTFRAPTSIGSATTVQTRFSVKYDYTGYKRANIPIVDGVNRKEPKTKYKESSVSYSPIQIIFDPPVGKSIQEGDKMVKVYWGVDDQPFELGVNFKHVGSSTVGEIRPTKIQQGKLSIELDHLEVAPDLRCDFEQSGNKLISKDEINVPGKRVCTLKPVFQPGDQMEVTAFVDASFDFTYEFRKTQTFKIYPLKTLTRTRTITQTTGIDSSQPVD
jgi:hypothetical protein